MSLEGSQEISERSALLIGVFSLVYNPFENYAFWEDTASVLWHKALEI